MAGEKDFMDAATPANVVWEWSLVSDRARDSEACDVDVIWTAPDGRKRTIPAFWAGENVWRARFASPTIGEHRLESRCTDPSDRGLHGRTALVVVMPNQGDNPLFSRGPIGVRKGERHFRHA